MRLAVVAANGRAFAFVELRQRLLTHLVVVVRYLASVRGLVVAPVLFGFNHFGQALPSRFHCDDAQPQACQTASRGAQP